MGVSINIYTDGSSLGNPGPGGYGIILEWKKKNYIKEYSKVFKYTTNNIKELLAVVVALEKLKINRANVVVFTDSKYIVDSVELRRVFKWENNNFKKIKNPDLWIRFLKMNSKYNVKFIWIKGHSNHPQNERCDELAVMAAKNNPVERDLQYEKFIKNTN